MQSSVSFIVLGAAMALTGGTAGAVDLKPGDSFPDIALPTLANGTPGGISQFRGKKLILHIFASW